MARFSASKIWKEFLERETISSKKKVKLGCIPSAGRNIPGAQIKKNNVLVWQREREGGLATEVFGEKRC